MNTGVHRTGGHCGSGGKLVETTRAFTSSTTSTVVKAAGQRRYVSGVACVGLGSACCCVETLRREVVEPPQKARSSKLPSPTGLHKGETGGTGWPGRRWYSERRST